MANTTQWLSKALINLISTELGSTVQVQHTGAGLSLSVPVGNGSQPHITLDGLGVDATNGLTGHLHLATNNAQGLSTSLIDGFSLALTGFDLQLQQAGLTSADIKAQLTIPYFSHADGTKETIDVDLGIRHDGSLALTLSPQQSNPDHMTPDGLLKLAYNIGQQVTIELDIDALEFDNPSPHVYQLVMGGKLLITTGGLNWPSFDFKGLRIDNQGHVQLDGGWIDLPASTAIDFYTFNLSLQKLGFGADTNGRWIGFNGDIQLVEGVPLGGSVRGLRLNLETGELSFASIAVSFEIPDVLSFSGEIDHIAASDVNGLKASGVPNGVADSMAKISPSIFPANIFMGDVDVVIHPAGDLEVDAKFIVGNFGSTPVFFLALDVELPVGIPIFLDVALYGMEGLFASNLRPDPTQMGETWWDWYKNPTPGNPGSAYSATDVMKWLPYPHPGALALGAGVTIGTEADDGFTASAGITFILMLPGPVIMFVGKAKILSKRVSNAGDYDSGGAGISFDALATFDGSAGTFDLDIDAQYKIPIVLDIEASAVLHVAPPNWYFAMGLPPHDKRVRARIFDLFESDSYFVVSDNGLLLGSYVGYNKEWDFGPLSVGLNAYIAMEGAIQWSPLVIAGGLELHGDAHLDAFGIGIGISVDALLEGKAPDPFWVHGEFHVELDTPWPLPNVGASISLTWGGDNDHRPISPLPLSHIDATLVDHVGSSDHYTLLSHRPNWPAPDSALVYDANPAPPGLLAPSQPPMKYWASVWASQQNPQVSPPASLSLLGPEIFAVLPDVAPPAIPYATVIPQDAHFTLDFAHPVNDQTGGGFTNGTSSPLTEPTSVTVPSIVPPDDMSHINLNPPSPQWVRFYSLHQVALYEYTNGQWQVVAAQPQKPASTTPLKGAWLSTVPLALNGASDNTRLKIIPQMSTGSSLAIVPDGQRLYALKVVTSVESHHTDGSNSQTDGPIIEFAYFQTASGPGVGIIDTNQPSPHAVPNPAVSAPYSSLGEQVPSGPVPSVSPLGGQLLDLHTYTQWSWPDDGDVAAYYGYSLNVEFNESYVYNLYTSSPDPGPNPPPHIAASFAATTGGMTALHMRCVERNNQHVLLLPVAIHVPSIPAQSALASIEFTIPMPAAITNPGGLQHSFVGIHAALDAVHLALQPQARLHEQQQLLNQPSDVQLHIQANMAIPMSSVGETLKVQERAVLQALASSRHVALTSAQISNPALISPAQSASLIQEALEWMAALQARNIWPQPLRPRTRYTLDVVAGPLGGYNPRAREGAGSNFINLASQAFQGADAITILATLENFYAYEDALTTLQRVQFTTSSYATFTEHLANAVEQSRIAAGIDPSKPGVAPIRHYPTTSDMGSWLNDVQNGDGTNSPLSLYSEAKNTYTQARSQLAAFVGSFNPWGDNLPPNLPPPANQPVPNPVPGQAGLRANRQSTQQVWTDFSATASLFFDKVIVALGRADLVSNRHVPTPPDTELSEFVDSAGRIQALLLESPEPLPWRRIWQWITLQGVEDVAPSLDVLPLWSADGTRGLLLPLEQHITVVPGHIHNSEVIHPSTETSSPIASALDPEATVVSHGAGGIVHVPLHPLFSGQYTLTISFHGNIGAEVPCITTSDRRGNIEDVTFAPLVLLPPVVFKPLPRLPH